MEMLLFIQPRNRATLLEHYANLKTFTPQELVDAYNHSFKVGIVGSMAQGLYLVTLRKVFLDTFGQSPIEWIDGCLLRFTTPIILKDNQWQPISISN